MSQNEKLDERLMLATLERHFDHLVGNDRTEEVVIRRPARRSQDLDEDLDLTPEIESIARSLEELRRTAGVSPSAAREIRVVLKYVTSNMAKSMEHLNEVAKGVLKLEEVVKGFMETE